MVCNLFPIQLEQYKMLGMNQYRMCHPNPPQVAIGLCSVRVDYTANLQVTTPINTFASILIVIALAIDSDI